jgi:hypothetical protein
MLLGICAAYPHVITTVADVEQAYLWSILKEKVDVWPKPGIPLPKGHVLKLLKAIYSRARVLVPLARSQVPWGL